VQGDILLRTSHQSQQIRVQGSTGGCYDVLPTVGIMTTSADSGDIAIIALIAIIAITPSRHHAITPSRHHAITPSRHHAITLMEHANINAIAPCS